MARGAFLGRLLYDVPEQVGQGGLEQDDVRHAQLKDFDSRTRLVLAT